MAGTHVGVLAGELSILGTTHRGASHVIRGMIGIGISATAVAGASTSGGAGADTTTLGDLTTTITTTTTTLGMLIGTSALAISQAVAVTGVARCVAHVWTMALPMLHHTVSICVSLRS